MTSSLIRSILQHASRQAITLLTILSAILCTSAAWSGTPQFFASQMAARSVNEMSLLDYFHFNI